ncbi:MAG: hypothetical protein J6K13_03455 [Clostridia bacterium]|nr:hypothetical protein [Clostridia bacterium]
MKTTKAAPRAVTDHVNKVASSACNVKGKENKLFMAKPPRFTKDGSCYAAAWCGVKKASGFARSLGRGCSRMFSCCMIGKAVQLGMFILARRGPPVRLAFRPAQWQFIRFRPAICEMQKNMISNFFKAGICSACGEVMKDAVLA